MPTKMKKNDKTYADWSDWKKKQTSKKGNKGGQRGYALSNYEIKKKTSKGPGY